MEKREAMGPHVLVVEDEGDVATLLRYNLEKEGYRVTVAVDGDEALLAAEEAPPDLVLLDWMLPRALPGIEVCRRRAAMRAIAFAGSTPAPTIM
jgi:two-component system phosphate regulon response regulator PhoB